MQFRDDGICLFWRQTCELVYLVNNTIHSAANNERPVSNSRGVVYEALDRSVSFGRLWTTPSTKQIVCRRAVSRDHIVGADVRLFC
jgi:hypothetical protein